jgi:hypothetical protein
MLRAARRISRRESWDVDGRRMVDNLRKTRRI